MTSTRAFRIEPVVFERCPNFRRSIIMAHTDGIGPSPSALEAQIDAEAHSTVERHGSAPLDHPEIAAWRAAFTRCGWSAAKTRPAAEALLRRAESKGVPCLGLNAVDIGTIAMLRFLMPVGVHVLDDLPAEEPLVLGQPPRLLRFVDFAGDQTQTDPDEIVYFAGDQVLTRRWVWRQGPVGSATLGAHLLAINVDSACPESDMSAAIVLASELLAKESIYVSDVLHLNTNNREATGHLLR